MGRPPIDDEFAQFADWMRTTNRCSGGVAQGYVSYIRRIDRDIGPGMMNQEAINAYFAKAQTEDRGYSRLRSAWTVFVEYMDKVKNVQLPIPYTSAALRNHHIKPGDPCTALPQKVRSALRVLYHNGIAISQMVTLTWVEVEIKEIFHSTNTHIRVPNKPAQWLIPSSAMRIIYEYAQPGPNLYRPLVPRAPNSDDAYTSGILRREIFTLSPEEMEEQKTHAQGASALGSVARHLVRPKDEEEETPKTTTYEVLDLLSKSTNVKSSFSPPAASLSLPKSSSKVMESMHDDFTDEEEFDDSSFADDDEADLDLDDNDDNDESPNGFRKTGCCDGN